MGIVCLLGLLYIVNFILLVLFMKMLWYFDFYLLLWEVLVFVMMVFFILSVINVLGEWEKWVRGVWLIFLIVMM